MSEMSYDEEIISPNDRFDKPDDLKLYLSGGTTTCRDRVTNPARDELETMETIASMLEEFGYNGFPDLCQHDNVKRGCLDFAEEIMKLVQSS